MISSQQDGRSIRYSVIIARDVAVRDPVVVEDHQAGPFKLLVVFNVDRNLVIVKVHDLPHMPQPDLL